MVETFVHSPTILVSLLLSCTSAAGSSPFISSPPCKAAPFFSFSYSYSITVNSFTFFNSFALKDSKVAGLLFLLSVGNIG